MNRPLNLATAAKKNEFAALLFEALERQLDTKSKAIVARHRKEMADELEAMRVEVVTAVALKIAKHTQVDMAYDRLMLTVEYKEAK